VSTSKKIGLVAPPKRRRGGIYRAREQFDLSPLFRRARDFCDREYGEWHIITVQHGLIAPHQVIGGDDPALHKLSAAERWLWADGIARQLQARLERSAESHTFVLYASQRYAMLLSRAAPFATFELPLAGMSLGQQIRWYEQRLRIESRVLSRPLA
jgi:hypothetical protein